MANSEVIVYKGIKFRRYPESSNWADRVYYTPGIGDRQKGIRRLHEEIWQDSNGRPVPEGWHVHHKDHDPLNNDPSNLVCLDGENHRDHHAFDTSERNRSPEHLALLDRIRPLTVEWHRSEEGREWHREHGRQAYAARELEDFTCQQCGKGYRSLNRGEGTRFCSNACKSAWRRKAGLDDVERSCHRCGTAFKTNKYNASAHCSRSCAGRCGKSGQPCPGVQPLSAA